MIDPKNKTINVTVEDVEKQKYIKFRDKYETIFNKIATDLNDLDTLIDQHFAK